MCFSVWPFAFQYRGKTAKLTDLHRWHFQRLPLHRKECLAQMPLQPGTQRRWAGRKQSLWMGLCVCRDIKHCVLLEIVILMSAMWFWYLAKWYFSFCNYKLQTPWVHQLIKEEDAVVQQNWRHPVKRYQSDVNQYIEQFPKRTSRISISVSLDKQKFEVKVTF